MSRAPRAQKSPARPDPVRHGYVEHGVDGYYRKVAASYRNPHEADVVAALAAAHARRPLPLDRVCDLACGSGEITLALTALGARHVDGVDPYTGPAYHHRTGATAAPHTFADVAAGALADRRYDLVVCSYALHLAEPSRLAGITWALSAIAAELLVLSPHKRPPISVGWSRLDAFRHGRVHVRRFARRHPT